jgi:hypothetical protein
MLNPENNARSDLVSSLDADPRVLNVSICSSVANSSICSTSSIWSCLPTS